MVPHLWARCPRALRDAPIFAGLREVLSLGFPHLGVEASRPCTCKSPRRELCPPTGDWVLREGLQEAARGCFPGRAGGRASPAGPPFSARAFTEKARFRLPWCVGLEVPAPVSEDALNSLVAEAALLISGPCNIPIPTSFIKATQLHMKGLCDKVCDQFGRVARKELKEEGGCSG